MNNMLLNTGNDENGTYYIFKDRKYRIKRMELQRDEGSMFFRVVCIYEPDWQIVDNKEKDETVNK